MLQRRELSNWTTHMQTSARILLRNDWLREDAKLLAVWSSTQPKFPHAAAAASASSTSSQNEHQSPRWSFGVCREVNMKQSRMECTDPAETIGTDMMCLKAPEAKDGTADTQPAPTDERRMMLKILHTEEKPSTRIRKRKYAERGCEPRAPESVCEASTHSQIPEPTLLKQNKLNPDPHASAANQASSRIERPGGRNAADNLVLLVLESDMSMDRAENPLQSPADRVEIERLHARWERLGGRWLDHHDLEQIYELFEVFLPDAKSASAYSSQKCRADSATQELPRPKQRPRRNAVSQASDAVRETKLSVPPVVVIVPFCQLLSEQLFAHQLFSVEDPAMQQLHALACIAWQRGWASILRLPNASNVRAAASPETILLTQWIEYIEQRASPVGDRSNPVMFAKEDLAASGVEGMLQACSAPNPHGVFAGCYFSFAQELEGDCNGGMPSSRSRGTQRSKIKARVTTARGQKMPPLQDSAWQRNAERLIRLAGGIYVRAEKEDETACLPSKTKALSRQGSRRIKPIARGSGLRHYIVFREPSMVERPGTNATDESATCVPWSWILATACSGAIDLSSLQTERDRLLQEAAAASEPEVTSRTQRKRSSAAVSPGESSTRVRRSRRR
jgi:hypothetical protein